MKQIIYVITLISTIVMADKIPSQFKPDIYADFGVEGKQYEIVEDDIYKAILTAAQQFEKDLNTTEVKNMVKDQIKERATFNTSLSNCKKTTSTNWEDDYFTFTHDYYNPFGRLVFKKGDKHLAPPVPGERHVCFIDGTIKLIANNQIDFFKKQDPNCVFLISNRNVMDFYDKYPKLEIYPASQGFFDRFGIKCIPAMLDFKDVQKRIRYFNIGNFKSGN